MKQRWIILAVLAAAALVVGAAHVVSQRKQGSSATAAQGAEPDAAPVAKVQVVPLQEGTIDETVTALGTVEAAPGEVEAFSVPFESRVSRVLVVNGQPVEAGQALVEVEPSADSVLELDQARQERDAAKSQLGLLKQREEMRLATRQEVLQAEQALAAVELRLSSLEKRGIDGRQALHATGPGIVARVDVQQGQMIPAGAPLVETIHEDKIAVRLGVEGEDADRLHPGLSVRIQPVNGDQAAFDGQVSRVGREVNVETRLVSVFVTPSAGARLLLNQYVRGLIQVSSRKGLLAPPAAVLPDGDAQVLYTVEDGHAVRHEVQVGLQNARQVEVSGPGLRAEQMAVVVGNSELEDGMAVEVEPSR